MGQLILVRHGQASFGADDYDVLSETGWEQGRALGSWYRESGLAPTTLVRGDLRRHRETLEAMASSTDWSLDDVVVDADWNEFDHVPLVAAFPGVSDVATTDRRGFQEIFERATAAWTSGEHVGDFETYAEFVARSRAALERAAASAGTGRTVVVVTSGGVIAAVCAALLDPEGDDPAAARIWSRLNTVTANASFTRLTVGGSGARLLTFNEHPHLDGALRTYR